MYTYTTNPLKLSNSSPKTLITNYYHLMRSEIHACEFTLNFTYDYVEQQQRCWWSSIINVSPLPSKSHTSEFFSNSLPFTHFSHFLGTFRINPVTHKLTSALCYDVSIFIRANYSKLIIKKSFSCLRVSRIWIKWLFHWFLGAQLYKWLHYKTHLTWMRVRECDVDSQKVAN